MQTTKMVFDSFRRILKIRFFLVDQRRVLGGAVYAAVFLEVEMADVASAAEALLVPALREGINQRVMTMRAEVRRFKIGAMAFRADAGRVGSLFRWQIK